jgi:hypothetical protein
MLVDSICGHDLQSFSLPTMIPHEQQMDMLERLAAEVIPVVRQNVPTTLWTDQDPYAGRTGPEVSVIRRLRTASLIT